MTRRITPKDGADAVAMLDTKAKPKRTTATKPAPKKATKADRVRALLDQGKTVGEIAKALDDVSWAYAWDIAAAWEKKTGKTIIAAHMPAKAKKVPRRPRTSKGSALKDDQLAFKVVAPTPEGAKR